MKTKLLKRLRRIGRQQVHIYSTTSTGGLITGMRYGYSDDAYSHLFSFGDTPEDVQDRAMRIYIEKEIKRLRAKEIKNKNP